MACAIPIPWQVNGATSWDEPDEYREMNQAIKQLAEATTKGGAETAVDPQALQNLAMALAKVGDGEGAGTLADALNQLAGHPDNLANLANEATINAALHALHANLNNPDVLLKLIKLLSKLAISDKLKQVIVDGGGVEYVMHALRTHVTHAKLVGAGVSFLANLAFNSETCAAKVIEAHGGAALQAIVKRYATDPKILKASAIAISNIMYGDDGTSERSNAFSTVLLLPAASGQGSSFLALPRRQAASGTSASCARRTSRRRSC